MELAQNPYPNHSSSIYPSLSKVYFSSMLMCNDDHDYQRCCDHYGCNQNISYLTPTCGQLKLTN